CREIQFKDDRVAVIGDVSFSILGFDKTFRFDKETFVLKHGSTCLLEFENWVSRLHFSLFHVHLKYVVSVRPLFELEPLRVSKSKNNSNNLAEENNNYQL
ncbi:hypothetical protein TorRG33x02_193080, partial [Trema orientale]